ncbi:hypothetical protein FHR24_000686 [Wenyingzhuangia heitensis]|uniref:Outer membrane protein beta-barrel domain-containing protein n=1 Tax=Wenyingzhuangia heitensis TaxID=1487859 RepID=A0ABX0U626_9FLAO|nr:porin family protein [Wenyingzhuangia heitensis]NIJ44247.1 hypothetical protein [Wenyingzhuangia heitensis]
MKLFSFILFFITPLILTAQDKLYADEKYYEDQLYIGVQYNSFVTYNKGINNNGVPYSFDAGFIKDMPLNKKRNIGLGIGIGYSYDILRPNITATPNGTNFDYAISNDFSSYKYQSHNIEIPFEFRWRTSTPTNNSFWRIYTGASAVYNISSKTEFNVGSKTVTYSDLEDLTKINYTVYTSIGLGTWNLHLKYYLKSPFKDSVRTIDDQKLSFNQLKIGVLFYIL